MVAADPSAADPGVPNHLPSAALAPYVTSVSGYVMDGVDIVHHGLPSTELTFILALDTPLTVGWSADRSQAGDFRAMVSGLHTTPAFIFPTGPHRGIQLGLTPLGARALFGLPAAALHAELVDLQSLWANVGAGLVDRLAGCTTWEQRFAVLDRALLALIRPAEIRGELTWAWHQLVRRQAPHTVALADEIGWSRGYFARIFAAEFGLKPKETARIARFGWAKRDLGVPGATLAEVASRCGYADQAHLNREWRRLAGCTPTGWRAEMLAFVQDESRPSVQD